MLASVTCEPPPVGAWPATATTLRRRGYGWHRLGALLLGLVFAIGLAEVALHLAIGPPRVLGRPYFRDAAGVPFDVASASVEAERRGLFEPLPAEQTPRPRFRFAPGSRFFMCYEDASLLHDDWLDDHGCVEVRINRFGLRERETLAPDNKGADERRILCLGDSFTFGWGVPVELGWVRRLEDDLRRSNGNVRTINCGLSGTLTVDEYWWGLRTRFGAFQPDVVIVSIYLNDLIPSQGLSMFDPYKVPTPTGWLLLDYLRLALAADPLRLDPATNWVDLALGLPEDVGTAMGVYGPDKPFAGMWSQGAPQAALIAMRDWCSEHQARLLVTLWPFLQGLGPGEHYPFQALHDLVGAYCAGQGIPLLDLRSALDAEAAAQLWVTPFDKHANPRAQALAEPAISAFVRAHWPR